jgi:hypothetical protein
MEAKNRKNARILQNISCGPPAADLAEMGIFVRTPENSPINLLESP